MAEARVTISLQTGSVIIEGEPGEILEVLKEINNLAFPKVSEVKIIPGLTATPQSVLANGVIVAPAPLSGNTGVPGVREFGRKFKEESITKKIAVLAYHAKVYGGVPVFTTEQMGDWFTQCHFTKPKDMRMAITDAARFQNTVKRVGRGEYTITTDGENLVTRMLETGDSTA